MKRYSMFLGWKNQYCENDYITKYNLQVQFNPYQIANDILHRTRQKISQFIWKHKKPQIAKAILRKKTGAEEINILTSDYTTELGSSRQYGAGTKTEYTQMEQERKPRDKPLRLWIPYV